MPELPIDAGVAPYVAILMGAGVETFDSCQGGRGHGSREPVVWFHGERSEGFRAMAVARNALLPVRELRRVWSIVDGEPTGPHWCMAFREPSGASGKRAAGEEQPDPDAYEPSSRASRLLLWIAKRIDALHPPETNG